MRKKQYQQPASKVIVVRLPLLTEGSPSTDPSGGDARSFRRDWDSE